MLMFEGIGRTSDGRLKIIILPAGTAPPAGSTIFKGLARSSDGYLYVVLA